MPCPRPGRRTAERHRTECVLLSAVAGTRTRFPKRAVKTNLDEEVHRKGGSLMTRPGASRWLRKLREGSGVIGINGAVGKVGSGWLQRLAIAIGGKNPAKWPQFRLVDLKEELFATLKDRLAGSSLGR